jgi:ubiquinone/menaquinone biosynthesis C-methylase UbiE
MPNKKKKLESHAKKVYDRYGVQYQATRDERKKERLYNELLEVPCMTRAVGNVNGKIILDIGCGAGVHASQYLKKGARVFGIDISKTMIELAKARCKGADFRVASMNKLPFKDSSFDIVTGSLVVGYADNLGTAFKQVRRVLKRGGLFYYSDISPINSSVECYEDDELRIKGLGRVSLKKKGDAKIFLGQGWNECIDTYEMLPGMTIKSHRRTFRTHLRALQDSGMELIDFIDCKPVPGFKRYDAEAYQLWSRIPIFSIWVCKKK